MQNRSVEECIITALDGDDINLVKYFPYILQDFWEIGTPPDDIIEIIRKYKKNHSGLGVLDLGSGKGAVSIRIALELKCNCFGIDALDDFVVFSNNKAREYSVNDICTFETNDIRVRLNSLGRYDVIVLGALGPVFGDYYDTLMQLEAHLENNGLIIINDAYVEDTDNASFHSGIQRKNDLLEQTERAGMELLEILADDNTSELDDEYKTELENLARRCLELADKYPEDKDLLLGYVEKQKREYEIMSNEIVPAIFVFRRKEGVDTNYSLRNNGGTPSGSCRCVF